MNCCQKNLVKKNQLWLPSDTHKSESNNAEEIIYYSILFLKPANKSSILISIKKNQLVTNCIILGPPSEGGRCPQKNIICEN